MPLPHRLALALALATTPAALSAQQDSLDLVIRHGRIVDGTGSPWYAGDLGIRGGRIAAIGRLDSVPARRTVDATGLVVAPASSTCWGSRSSPCW